MKPISLNIGDLQKNIEKRAIELKGLGEVEKAASFFPNPGIIGFIIRKPDFGQLEPKLLNEMSANLADGFGKPVTILQDDGILMGFFPQNVLRL